MTLLRWILPCALLVGLAGACIHPLPPPESFPSEDRADYALFKVRCGKCHSPKRGLDRRYDERGWRVLVRRMALLQDSGIQPGEEGRLSHFLAVHAARMR